MVPMPNDGNMASNRELPELSGEVTPITLGDWIVSIGPVMKDLTPLSAIWWQKTYGKAEEYYEIWRNSTPLQRVQITPELPQELQQSQYMRTEQRGVSLLLKAVPKETRDVLIASRELCSTTIIYRLLATFQPGGANEKALLLKHLTEISQGKDLNELGSSLRTWRRFFQRAVEIGTTLPDPTLLLRALDNPSLSVARIDAQSAFRLAQTRSQLGVDEKPTQDTVWRFSQCVLAEIETLQLLNGMTSTTSPTTTTNEAGHVAAKVKALELKTKGKGKESPGKTAKPCQFFGNTEGCKLGAQCRYVHDWNSISEKQGRCWTCSSTTHMRHECPTRQDGHSKLSSGGSGDGRDGKSKGKGKKGGGKKQNEGGQKENELEKSEKSKEEEQPAVKEVSDPKPTAATSQGGGTGSTSGGAQEGLVQEVTSLLRSLRASEMPSRMMRVCQLKKLTAEDFVTTLIDGGATHCLRTKRSQEEWDDGIRVKVQLASGEVEMRQCAHTNTLIVQEKIQPIVPVAKLLELGYTINWSRKECRIEHTKHGKVPVTLVQGCPTVDEDWGERLMKEVEEAEKKKMRVKAVLDCGIIAEDDYEKKIAALTSWFPNTPYRILEGVPGEKNWDPEQIPVNRRKRRQIERAKYLIIDMFSGKHDRRWKKLEDADTVVIEVDLLRGLNVMDPHVSGWIDSLIETGKVTTWLSAPPCRTVSACRQRGECDGGPVPLRGREGQERYGLPGLTARQQNLADHDATLWIKNLRWTMMVKEKRPTADILVEQPADPKDWKEGGENYPTFLTWEETVFMEEITGASRVTFDQGAVGHRSNKPTTIITTLEAMQQLQGLKSQCSGMRWAKTVGERIEQSKELAAWAPGLVEAIAQAVLQQGEERRVRALTKGDKDEAAMWEAHFAAGHTPYRRDCLLCVESMGRDRYRKRQSHPGLHTMSIDVAGPFDPGQDQEIHQPRYLMMATITIPMESEPQLPAGLNQLGHQVKAREDVPALEQEEQKKEGETKEQECHEDADGEGGLQDEEQFKEQPEKEEQGELQEFEIKVIEEANQKWKQFLTQAKQDEVKTTSVTWGVPMQSRATKHVLEAVAKIYSRFRSLQIPILRLHCDRAREFTSAQFRAWVSGRDMHLTFSAGDEPTANSKIEREIGVMKGRVRVLLKSSKAPLSFWPLAARHLLEERFRQQLWSLGVKSPEVLPFGSVVMAKRKTWENRSQPWKWPFQKVRCWGPASDMSLTSRGHFLQTEDGKFLRSTVIIVPKQLATSQEDFEKKKEEQEDQQKQVNPVNLAPGNAEEATWDGGRLEKDHQEGDQQEQANPVTLAPGNAEEATWDGGRLDKGHQDEGQQTDKEASLQFARSPEGEVVIEETTDRDTFLVRNQDAPKFRIAEKTSPPQILQQEAQWLSLRSMQLRERGEWSEEQRNEVESRERCDQHRNLRNFIQEEMGRIQKGEQVSTAEMKIVEQAAKEVQVLEQQLEEDKAGQERRLRSLTKKVEEQILQTQIVPLEEVKRNPEVWREAFKKEYETLVAGPVLPITMADVQRMKEEGTEIEMLPTKAIASKKPPAKYKGRVVVCGNYAQEKEEENVAVGGACSIAIRSVIHTAAVQDWSIASVDVSGAFLQAPRRQRTKTTLASPPALLKDLGLVKGDEVWKIECALYGLTESPGDWAIFRDKGLRELKWNSKGGEWHLRETPEKHIWTVCNARNEVKGAVAVYVDDFLIATEAEELEAVCKAIKSKWVCSEEEMVGKDKAMRFCGFEIQQREKGGFWIGQTGYLADLLRKRNISGWERHPCPIVREGPDEMDIDLKDIREAQMIVGEAMWLSGRSRPDISYTTGLLSRLLHRRPKYACEVGQHLLRYLNATKDARLEYVRSSADRTVVEGCETISKSRRTLQIFSDVSFSPSHENHKSVQGICIEQNSNLLFWESVRQPFVALSTCEAELIGLVEGQQAGEGVLALLQVLDHEIEEQQLFGDNKASISICVNETGAWRTRHLRIRSHRIREILQGEGTTWKAAHIRGTALCADGFTKPLQNQSFARFLKLIGMKVENEAGDRKVKKLGEVVSEWNIEQKRIAKLAGIGGLLWCQGLQWLGFAVIICAVVMKWREEKEPLASQDTQDRKKIPQKKQGRDKEWIGFGRSGTTTPVELVGACTPQNEEDENKNEKNQGCRSQPGIRAFRLSPGSKNPSGDESGASNSHGEEQSRRSATASTARQRGKAALPEVSEKSTKVNIEVEKLSEDVEVSLRIRNKKEDQEGSQRSASSSGYMETSGNQASEKERRNQRVPSDLQRGLAEAEKQAEETPCNLRRFQKEPTGGNDQWDESLLRKEGWLIRCHKKHRVRPFHPLHGSTPEEGKELNPERTTVIFQGGERVGIVHDLWQDPGASKLRDYTGQWKGFTFFKVNNKNKKKGTKETDNEESDGSYEKVPRSEESW